MLINDIEMIIGATWCQQYPEYAAIIILFVTCLCIYTFGSVVFKILRL